MPIHCHRSLRSLGLVECIPNHLCVGAKQEGHSIEQLLPKAMNQLLIHCHFFVKVHYRIWRECFHVQSQLQSSFDHKSVHSEPELVLQATLQRLQKCATTFPLIRRATSPGYQLDGLRTLADLSTASCLSDSDDLS